MINLFSNKETTKGQRNEDLPVNNNGLPDSTMPNRRIRPGKCLFDI